MATNIKSTALDFENIKNNLKTYFQAQPEFADYNFEASGLSNILDVLAYNTHYNALVTNFALNESFLGTAQLRSSMVSLGENIGYIPDSRSGAVAMVNISLTYTGTTRPARIDLPKNQVLYGTIGNNTYAFYTREDLTAEDTGGVYVFKTSGNSAIIPAYEGVQKTKSFNVGQYGDAAVYVIPDVNLDLNTAEVRVKEISGSSTYVNYTNISKAISLTELSTLYLLKESPNGYFELSFGNGTALGKIPVPGNVVEIDYMSASGPAANDILSFTSSISIPGLSISDYVFSPIVTVNPSSGGSEKEGIESIRQNAPYMYASQNRMVTAADYASMVLRYFSPLIDDIVAWGGQDNVIREFGKVFISILFKPGLSPSVIETTKAEILRLAAQLSVLSFTVEFGNPQITYLETRIDFDFNSNLTSIPLGTMQSNVKAAAVNYFANNLGKFNQTFRLSNLLSELDDVSPAVLSSSAAVLMQQRIIPILSVPADFTLQFPAAIRKIDDDEYIITSSQFTLDGKQVNIKNALAFASGGIAVLQVVDITTGDVIRDNIGSYNSVLGQVNLVAFVATSISGSVNYIKISAVPANSNTINPTNNHVLYQDAEASYAAGTIVYTS